GPGGHPRAALDPGASDEADWRRAERDAARSAALAGTKQAGRPAGADTGDRRDRDLQRVGIGARFSCVDQNALAAVAVGRETDSSRDPGLHNSHDDRLRYLAGMDGAVRAGG